MKSSPGKVDVFDVAESWRCYILLALSSVKSGTCLGMAKFIMSLIFIVNMSCDYGGNEGVRGLGGVYQVDDYYRSLSGHHRVGLIKVAHGCWISGVDGMPKTVVLTCFGPSGDSFRVDLDNELCGDIEELGYVYVNMLVRHKDDIHLQSCEVKPSSCGCEN